MSIGGLADSIKVLVAPAYAVVQFSTIPSGAWVDISAYATKISIQRGTNHELQLSDAGTLTVDLADNTGKLIPNTSSLFPGLNVGGLTSPSSLFPNGAQRMPVRVQATVGANTYNLFSGYTESLGPSAFDNENWYRLELIAYDALKLATDAYMPSSYLGEMYMQFNPVFWYAITDTSMTTLTNKSLQNYLAYDSSMQNHNGTFGNVKGHKIVAGYTVQTKPEMNLEADTLKCSAHAIAVTTGSTWWMNFLATITSANSIQSLAPMLLASCHIGKGGWAITAEFSLSSNAWYVYFRGYNSAGAQTAEIASTTPLVLAYDQMVTLTYDSGTFTLYFNGVSQGTASGANVVKPSRQVVVMGTGGPGGVAYGPFYGGIGDIAIGSAALTAADVGATGTGFYSFVYANERTTGEWIGLQLDAIGVAALDRNLATGDMSLREPNAQATDTITVRSALEQTMLDEVGQLFVDGSGTFVFRNRKYATTYANHQSKAYFGTVPTSALGVSGFETVPFISASIVDNGDNLWTHVTGARGGGNQIIVATNAANSVPGRTGGYGVKTYHYPGSFNYTSDNDVHAALTYVANKYNKETVRVTELTVRPWVDGVGTTNPQWDDILGLDVWDTVTCEVSIGPSTGASFAGPLLIEGVDHDIDLETLDWKTTLHTSPAWSSFSFFTIGTSAVGDVPIAP